MEPSTKPRKEFTAESTLPACPLCGADGLFEMPLEFQRCMRSDGLLLDEPLRKYHCDHCDSLIGMNAQPSVPYQRSDGTSEYELRRHQLVADGIGKIIRKEASISAPLVLEIGGASFATSLRLKEAFPEFKIVSLEPNPETSERPEKIDIVVSDFFEFTPSYAFDVIFSNQVFEHIPDPDGFLQKSASMLSPKGKIIICCPTFATCGTELLFSDHIYHYSRTAMEILANGAGLDLEKECVAPWDPASHVYILGIPNRLRDQSASTQNCTRLSAAIKFYQDWKNQDHTISSLISFGKPVAMFGAGEFAQLISAYLPNTYRRIDLITQDSLTGARNFDKPVYPISEIDLKSYQFLIGVNKNSRKLVHERLIALGVSRNEILDLAI